MCGVAVNCLWYVDATLSVGVADTSLMGRGICSVLPRSVEKKSTVELLRNSGVLGEHLFGTCDASSVQLCRK